MARPGLIRAALAFVLPTSAALFPILTGVVYGLLALTQPARRRLPGELAGTVFASTIVLSALLSGRGWTVVAIAGVFLILLSSLRLIVTRMSRLDAQPLVLGMLALLALNLVFAVVQVHGLGLPRASGLMMHANLLGAVAAPLAFVFLPRTRLGRLDRWRFVGVVIALAVLYYCASRGAMLGLLIGSVATALVIVSKPREVTAGVMKRYYKLGLIAILVLVIGGSLAANVPGSPLYGRLQVLDNVGDPLGRTVLWSAALELVAHRPFLGYGPGAWVEYVTVVEPMIRADIVSHSHSLFLEVMLWAGVLGLGALVWLASHLLLALWKSSRLLSGWSMVGIGALGTMATVSLFDSPASQFQVLSLWALTLGLILTISEPVHPQGGSDDWQA